MAVRSCYIQIVSSPPASRRFSGKRRRESRIAYFANVTTVLLRLDDPDVFLQIDVPNFLVHWNVK